MKSKTYAKVGDTMDENNKKLTLESIIDIIIRRRWIILISLFLSILMGIVLIYTLPRAYEAKTLILIESPRVPQEYVQSIVSGEAGERINTISQQIMSRTSLEKVIKNFGLFEGPEYENVYLEDKIDDLRDRISVDLIQDTRRQTDAFTITFRDRDPQRVKEVANGLASYFINENLKVRESQAIGTSDFLDSELASRRKRLEELEEKIKDYRKSNMGELPEQLETNLRILERLQQNLTDQQQALREAKARMAGLKSQISSGQPSVVVIGGDQQVPESDLSLEDLRKNLEALLGRYTEKHPDVLRVKKMIADLETKASDPNAASRQSIPAAVRLQIEEARVEIQTSATEIEDLKHQIKNYQERVELTPRREQELLSLRRDYQNIQSSYDSLLSRKLEADIAVNMERKQKGEQFRIIDPAKVPERPVEPNMKKLFLLVMVAGFGISGGITYFLEFTKPSFRHPEEIEAMTGVPVLAEVPIFLESRERKLKKINFGLSVAFSVFVLGLITVFGLISINGV